MTSLPGDLPRRVTAIIVTHDSGPFVVKVVASLRHQTLAPQLIRIVDSGSSDAAYLADIAPGQDLRLLTTENVGFCRANNLAVHEDGGGANFYLFINPDALIDPAWIETAIRYLEQPENERVGVVSTPLHGYDPQRDAPSGRYDSLGIERKWYGRWYDRGQGLSTAGGAHPTEPSEPRALCGALLLIRGTLVRALLAENGQVFDESLFMYKDDIELSLRIRRHGWRLRLLPGPTAYHCRGWNTDRRRMSVWSRRISARNDLKIAVKYPSPFLAVYALRYLYVRFIETGRA